MDIFEGLELEEQQEVLDYGHGVDEDEELDWNDF